MTVHPEIYQQALDCQNACNGQALVRTLHNLYPLIKEDMEARGENMSTDALNEHPVVVMFVAKLASLFGTSVDMYEAVRRAECICQQRMDPDINPPEGFTLWVKKLGQTHLAGRSASTTVCGMPMLGNHYGDHPNKVKCPDCWTAVAKHEAGVA